MVKRLGLACVFCFIMVFGSSAYALDQKEAEFGYYSDKTYVALNTIVFNEKLNKRVNEIGNRLVKTDESDDMKYTFRVVNDPVINAYSTAGGNIYIDTGLLDILETEDELAAVLAHEIKHAKGNHQIKFIKTAHQKKVAGQVAGVALGVALGVAGGAMVASSAPAYSAGASQLTSSVVELGVRVGGMMGNAMSVAMIKGYGKKQELEADAYAVRCLQKAGCDPRAMISVFQKLKDIKAKLGINENNYLSGLINAKPGLEERIKNAETLIANSN